jgi:hypothetical protein
MVDCLDLSRTKLTTSVTTIKLIRFITDNVFEQVDSPDFDTVIDHVYVKFEYQICQYIRCDSGDALFFLETGVKAINMWLNLAYHCVIRSGSVPALFVRAGAAVTDTSAFDSLSSDTVIFSVRLIIDS